MLLAGCGLELDARLRPEDIVGGVRL